MDNKSEVTDNSTTTTISNGSATNVRKKNILLGCTGSVASIKIPELVTSLKQNGAFNVQVVTTEHAKHFFDLTLVDAKVYTDADEWRAWTQRSDPVLHIELRRWADALVIAPLDANTLAKMAQGLCDNLLTCVVRAWDVQRPLLYAPAMNTLMWEHPLTAKHIEVLNGFGYRYIPAVEKTLMCGDKGMGAMASVQTIVQTVIAALEEEESKASNQNQS